jgi:hypothetical protein
MGLNRARRLSQPCDGAGATERDRIQPPDAQTDTLMPACATSALSARPIHHCALSIE